MPPFRIPPGEKIAFARGDSLYVATYPDFRKAVRVGQGQDPDLSPDGKRVTFEESSGSGDRSFCIRDADTGRLIARRTGTLPHFSPDGTQIAFSLFTGNRWTAWLTDSALRSAKNLAGAGKDGPAFISGWTSNGLLITYSEDLGGPLYALNSGGSVVKKVRMADVSGGSDTMIPFGCAWTDDLSLLAYEAQTDEESGGEDPGPLIALFLFDFRTGKRRRLTPKGLNAGQPSWRAPGVLSFVGTKKAPHLPKPTAFLLDIATGAIQPIQENIGTITFAHRAATGKG